MIRTLLSAIVLASGVFAAAPPESFGPVPSPRQLAWQELELYAFVHFTTNTFTGKEWGFGDEDPDIFNPTEFDADQIVGTLAETGFKGVILTCKHHDGFCLWPTATTGHNVSKSPWKDGGGDVVKEFSDAAKRHGIGFGVYLSPWDRNNADYGTEKYVKTYQAQLRELLTQYGPLFEVWHDGANGGDGYYGGAVGTRSIPVDYYQWPANWEMVRKLQPDAVVFSDVGPDVRWVGNEHGVSPYPNFARFSPVGRKDDDAAPGYSKTQVGSADGKIWMPAETDVSIRPGWFWHEYENAKVRTPKNLMDLYFTSVGRGTSLLLNVPPDRRGLIHENDAIALRGFKKALDAMYAKNLADGAKATADVARGAGFEAGMVLDGDKKTYWAAPDGTLAASVELALPEAREFSVIRLAEPIQLGQRIVKFAVDVKRNGGWSEWIADGKTVGPHTLLRGEPVTSDGVRVRILESGACPCLTEVSLWLEPTGVPDEIIGGVKIAELMKDGWKAEATTSSDVQVNAPLSAVDGRKGSFWSSAEKAPQSLVVDMGETHDLAAVTMLPRQDGGHEGMVDRYKLETSEDGKTWSKPLEGEFSNLRANPVEQRIGLPDGSKARYLRFTGTRVLEGDVVTVAEIGAIGRSLPVD